MSKRKDRGMKRKDHVEYRGSPGTVRSVAHWLHPSSLDVRLDDGRLIYDLETHFKKMGAQPDMARSGI